jgi:hypothetical protein
MLTFTAERAVKSIFGFSGAGFAHFLFLLLINRDSSDYNLPSKAHMRKCLSSDTIPVKANSNANVAR